jgi:hypothetical protein
MGFFKKIGTAVKKGVKQISIKNLVKVGTPFLSMIPLVGGVAQSVVENTTASNEAKKQAQQAENEGRLLEAEALYKQSDLLAKTAGSAVGQQAGSVLKAFSKGVTDEAIAQTSVGLKNNIGDIGATMADESIKSWLKMHWKHLVYGFVAIVGGVFIYKKYGKPGKKVTKKRY